LDFPPYDAICNDDDDDDRHIKINLKKKRFAQAYERKKERLKTPQQNKTKQRAKYKSTPGCFAFRWGLCPNLNLNFSSRKV